MSEEANVEKGEHDNHQGQVVAVGDDRMAVLGEGLEKLGPVPCYIEWVEEETPRKARITSTWIAR